MNNNTVIQAALAVLITNLNALENYDCLREQITSDLNLNTEETSILDNFYHSNKVRFTASARILNKNRWDDIKASLPLTVNFLNEQSLNNLWDGYLKHLTIDNNPSKNPLAESICIAIFAEQGTLLNSIEKQVVRYERIRNEVAFKHHENFTFHPLQTADLSTTIQLERFEVYIHECYQIENFDYNIRFLLNKKVTLPQREDCAILFFKNLKKEGIGTLNLSQDVRKIIEKTLDCKNLSEAFSFFKEQLSKNEFLEFLKKLAHIGVWHIQQREQ